MVGGQEWEACPSPRLALGMIICSIIRKESFVIRKRYCVETLTSALNNLFKSIGSWTAYFLAVSSLGALTMAILQVVKDITPTRRLFQRSRMRQFLQEHAELAKQNFGFDACWCKAEDQLIRLATDGDLKAFYGLEIEKLCGQWNATLQIVIDYPAVSMDLLACLSARSAPDDFRMISTIDKPRQLLPHEEVKLPTPEQQSRLEHRQSFMDARTRVSHQIQRAIDSFQISTSFRWKWGFQMASYVVSFALAVIALRLAVNVTTSEALLSAAIAGFLAPVARDILAAIQKLRA